MQGVESLQRLEEPLRRAVRHRREGSSVEIAERPPHPLARLPPLRREQELAGVLGVLSAAEQRELTRLHEKLLARIPDGVPDARRVCRYCDVHACGHSDGRCPVTRGIDERGLRD